MKRFSTFLCFIFVVAFCFASNPESDFSYELSDDGESIIVTGVKKNLSIYEIPKSIEDIPVFRVEMEFLGVSGKSEVNIILPEGLKEFYLTQIYSRGAPISHITINALPSSLERCKIYAQRNQKIPDSLFITLKGSLAQLNQIVQFRTDYVDFEEKRITVKNSWEEYDFQNSNIKEVIFEEGCKNIDGFRYCKNLAKVTLPTTVAKIQDNAFIFCTSLSELIIPDSLERIDFCYNKQNFDGTKLPLKSQVRLRKLGYSGSFSNN